MTLTKRLSPPARTVVAGASLAALLAPLAVFAVLQGNPALNPQIVIPHQHFYIVVTASFLALILALAVLQTALRLHHPPTLLLGLGFLSIASIFLVHGLSTPGMFLGPNPLIEISARLSLLVGAVFLAISAWIGDSTFSRWIGRWMPLLLTIWVVLLGGFGVAGLVAAASSGPPASSLSTPVQDDVYGDDGYGQYGDGAATEGNRQAGLHSHAPAASGAGILRWIPVTSPPGSWATFILALALFTTATVGYWRRYSQTHLPLVGALAIAALLLLEAQVAMFFGTAWRLNWWEYHVLMLVGFLLGVGALLWEFGKGRSLRRVMEGMFSLRDIVQLELEYTDAISVLAAATEARDPYTQGHTVRVAEWSCRIGREMSLPPSRILVLARAGLLHDVGKLGVPDAVLKKPGPLTPEEFAIIKEHPRQGHDILRRVGHLEAEIRIIIAHHERMDGRGYPHGLAGEEIPLEARILAVADVFDSLTTSRPYRGALPRDEALAIVQEETGDHLDPECVQALLRVLELPAAAAARIAR